MSVSSTKKLNSKADSIFRSYALAQVWVCGHRANPAGITVCSLCDVLNLIMEVYEIQSDLGALHKIDTWRICWGMSSSTSPSILRPKEASIYKKQTDRLKERLIQGFLCFIWNVSRIRVWEFLFPQSANKICEYLVSSGHGVKRGYQMSSFSKAQPSTHGCQHYVWAVLWRLMQESVRPERAQFVRGCHTNKTTKWCYHFRNSHDICGVCRYIRTIRHEPASTRKYCRRQSQKVATDNWNIQTVKAVKIYLKRSLWAGRNPRDFLLEMGWEPNLEGWITFVSYFL